MKTLLDTHFLLWIVLDVPRLDEFPWLKRYRPWGLSPVSILEVQFLAEVGRLEVDAPAFVDALRGDPRFTIDEVGLLTLVEKALPHAWTRDPFDRMLVAHSDARRVPLCTLDRTIRRHHRRIVDELAA